MKAILALLAFIQALIAFKIEANADDTCKIFECGKIGKYEGENRCIDILYNANEYPVQKCNSTSFCSAVIWQTPQEATSNATCKLSPTPETVNITVPGDVCKNTAECWGKDGEKSCDGGVCVSKLAEGDTCEDVDKLPGHIRCPLGLYCNSGKKCTKQIGEGQKCDNGGACKFGLNCVAINSPDFNDYKCTKLHSFENGQKFDIDQMLYGNNKWVGYDSMCTSYHSIYEDESVKECRQADTSNDQTEEGLKKDKAGVECKYTNYDADADKPMPKTSYSKCGFNNQTYAYCDKRRGDTWFKNALSNFTKVDLTAYTCHPLSTVDSCGAFVDIKDSWKLSFEKALLEANYDWGYALYAHNDVCVARTVTPMYWQGSHPDDDGFAANFKMYTALTLALAILMALEMA